MVKNYSSNLLLLGLATALLFSFSINRFGAMAALDAPAFTGCGGQNAPLVNADYEQRVVELVNQERAALGLPPLKMIPALVESARYHATDLGQDDYFNHDTYDRVDGQLSFVCGTWDRIRTFYSGARGENIAGGYRTPEAVMNGWMNSSGHRANILSTNSWEIGVGYYEGGGHYSRYWVQNFGRRNGVYPMVINGDDATTDSRFVSLYIYGEWDELRLRDGDQTWSEWMPFANEMSWTLAHGVGEHTLYAEMRTGSQNASTSDSILLTGDPQAVLGNLPEALTFNYSLAEQRASPSEHKLTPLDVNSGMAITWQLSSEGVWFNLSATQGQTPESVTLTVADLISLQAGAYPGSVTVTVTEPPDTFDSPQTIFLTLNVIDAPFHQVRLPLALR